MGVVGARRAAIAGMVAICAGSVAQAAPPCWRSAEVEAARVRQMQTMLMVATLRCRAAHLDIVADYNGFVTRQAGAIAAASLRIKQHFADAGGVQADYDRFATSLANSFGDDETNAATCAEAASLARDGAAAPTGGALDAIASARLFPAALPGGACDLPATATVTASVAPSSSKPPIVMLAAAPPPPVALPQDVIAALVVMARFRDAQAAPVTTMADSVQVAAVGG